MNAGKSLFLILVVVIIAAAGYYFLTMPDTRTTSEKVGDAVHDLGKGPDQAARQLEDRTPGQKIGDKIKDATAPQNGQ